MATAIKPRHKARKPKERPQTAKAERPIWETVAELGSQISEGDWENVPNDSSCNYKQQLYGVPSEKA